jgi:hypothetical protein
LSAESGTAAVESYCPAFAHATQESEAMSEKKNTSRRREATKRFTITGNYNADKTEAGDVCIVTVGQYEYGDIVVIECAGRFCRNSNTKPHYHAKYYSLMRHGKKCKFSLSTWGTIGGIRCKESDEQIIVGAVIKTIEKGRKQTTRNSKASTVDVCKPWGSLPFDEFEATTICADGSLSEIGVKAGDTAVVYVTQDIRNGDIVSASTPDGLFIRQYNFTPGGDVRLEPLGDEYDPLIYRPGEVKTIGRVVQFERNGRVITVSYDLRPVRTCAPLPLDTDGILDADWIGEGGE